MEAIHVEQFWFTAELDELHIISNLRLYHHWCGLDYVSKSKQLTLLNHAVLQAKYDYETAYQKICVLLSCGASIDVEKSSVNNCSTVTSRLYWIPNNSDYQKIAKLFLISQEAIQSYVKFHSICFLMYNNDDSTLQKLKKALRHQLINIHHQRSPDNHTIFKYCGRKQYLKLLLRNNLQISNDELTKFSKSCRWEDEMYFYLISKGYSKNAIIQGLSEYQKQSKHDLLKKAYENFQHQLFLYLQKYLTRTPDDIIKYLITFIDDFILPN